MDEVATFLDGGKLPCLLVENKADLLEEENAEKNPELEEFGSSNGFCGSFRTSAKTGLNINESMEYLIKNIIQRMEAMQSKGNEVFMITANNYISSNTSDRLKCKPAPAGTIIFPKIGAAIFTNKKRILFSCSCYDNNIFGVIPNNKIIGKFLYFLKGINKKDIKQISGIIPDILGVVLKGEMIGGYTGLERGRSKNPLWLLNFMTNNRVKQKTPKQK